MAEPAQTFDVQLARLTPMKKQGWSALVGSFLLELTRWLTCCCCCQSRQSFGLFTPKHKKDWSALKKATSCPAQLKVSTIDKQTIEVKITYAENAAMATQLYEVDVFMFFLKDLEAVTTNFYHDLWQSTRMHTPKIPLAAMAGGDTSDDLSGLIKQQLLVIQYKRLVGNEQDASVQKDIEHAIDSVVQQLRLQACMFRQSIRRAMKGITTKLEQAQGPAVHDLGIQKLSAQIALVVQQLAEVVNNLHVLCRPCDSEESPETVRETWKMVDEYMLTEAEVSLVKLLETLDKAVPAGSPAATQQQQQDHHLSAASPAACGSHDCCQHEERQACRLSDREETAGPDVGTTPRSGSESSKSFSSIGDGDAPQHATDLPRQASHADTAATAGLQTLHKARLSADSPAETVRETCSSCPVHRVNLVHSSASSLPISTISRQALLQHNDSAYLSPHPTSDQHTLEIRPKDSLDTGNDVPHGLHKGKQFSHSRDTASRGSGDSSLQSAYAMLCNPRQVSHGSRNQPSCQAETILEEEEQAWSHSNLRSLIAKAKALQHQQELAASKLYDNIMSELFAAVTNIAHFEANGCQCSEAELAAPEARVLTLAEARHLIVDAIEHLQDEMRERSYYECIIHDDDTYHNEVYTNRIKCLKHNARAAVVLQHESLRQSFVLADVVGASIAGIAMCIVIGVIYIGYSFSQ